MKKLFKSLTLALTVALAAVCLGVFAAACGDKDEEPVYAVYVVYEDGTPVNGHTDGTGYNMEDPANETYIKVQWCRETCSPQIILGIDGKASIKVSDIDFIPDHVTVAYLTEEYGEYDAALNYYHIDKNIDGPGEVKITLTKVS